MTHNDVRIDHGFLSKRVWNDSPVTVKAIKRYARKAQRRQAAFEVQQTLKGGR